MAGDWIAMRVQLDRDPATVHIARALGCSRREAVGHLHAVWSWFDAESRDGHARGVTPADLDAVIGVTGMCAAMMSTPDSAWLEVDPDGYVMMPAYDVWLSQSAKRRLLTTKRKQRQRTRGVTPTSRTERDRSVTTEQDRTEEQQREANAVASAAGGAGAPRKKAAPWRPKHEATVGLCKAIDAGREHWQEGLKPMATGRASQREMDRLLADHPADEVEDMIGWLFGCENGDYAPAGNGRFDWRSAIKTAAALRRNWDGLVTERAAMARKGAR